MGVAFGNKGFSSAFHEFRTVIRNRWSIFEEYGLTGKRFKGKSANWIPKFARRIVSLGERKERSVVCVTAHCTHAAGASKSVEGKCKKLSKKSSPLAASARAPPYSPPTKSWRL